MQAQAAQGPWWAALTVWAVVNAVNLLQTAGFVSRIRSGSMALNHRLGFAIIALAVPALIALIGFIRSDAGALAYLGPAVFLGFVALMVVVDYLAPVEFRSPPRSAILVPYLVLFFGSILLMGLPMYTLNRSFWLFTVVTSAALLTSMLAAMRKGVG